MNDNRAIEEAKFQGTKRPARGTRFVQSDPWRSSSADAWRGRLIVVSFIIYRGRPPEGGERRSGRRTAFSAPADRACPPRSWWTARRRLLSHRRSCHRAATRRALRDTLLPLRTRLRQFMRFEQMPEVQDRRLVRDRIEPSSRLQNARIDWISYSASSAPGSTGPRSPRENRPARRIGTAEGGLVRSYLLPLNGVIISCFLRSRRRGGG